MGRSFDRHLSDGRLVVATALRPMLPRVEMFGLLVATLFLLGRATSNAAAARVASSFVAQQCFRLGVEGVRH